MPFTLLLLVLYILAFVIGIIGLSKKVSFLKALAGILLSIAVVLTVLLVVDVNTM